MALIALCLVCCVGWTVDVQPSALLPGIAVIRATPVAHIPLTDMQSTLPWWDTIFDASGNMCCYTEEVSWEIDGIDTAMGGGPLWNLRVLDLRSGKLVTKSLVPKEFLTSCDLAVSHDGKTISFSSLDRTDGLYSLWKTDWSGAKPVRLSLPRMNINSSTWRPDDRVIACLSTTRTSMDHSDLTIFLIDLNRPGTVLEKHQIDGDFCGIRYSPDGRWLACRNLNDLAIIDTKTWRVYTIFAPRLLTLTISPDANDPSLANYEWLPDSQSLLATISYQLPEKTDHYQIYRVPLTGQATYLADGNIFNRSPDGRSLYLHQGGKDWRLDLTMPQNAK
jgi:WD40 repeat protein